MLRTFRQLSAAQILLVIGFFLSVVFSAPYAYAQVTGPFCVRPSAGATFGQRSCPLGYTFNPNTVIPSCDPPPGSAAAPGCAVSEQQLQSGQSVCTNGTFSAVTGFSGQRPTFGCVNSEGERQGGTGPLGSAALTPRPSSATVSDCAGTIITRSIGSTARCMGITLLIAVGTGIVSMLSWIPWMADGLINVVVQNTVTLTGFSTLYSKFSFGIEKGWGLIRDLANLAIIGIFVFVAICIILGLKEYGQKKLIAKVLIVAILINFSFLFTRLIINFSNALATNIYTKLIVNDAGVQTGIGGRFLHTLRISTAEQANESFVATYNTGSFGALMTHILVSSVVALVAGLALLYIAFLLVSRFIVLMLLLVGSSAAFAAYLLPSTTSWWSWWWDMLFRNAFLAPIMFIFLWLSLSIAVPVSDFLTGGARFSSFTNKVPDTPALNLLLNYLLVIGFLYAGIIVANSLSTSIGRRLAVNMTAAPFTLGAKFAGGTLRRAFGGARALDEKHRLTSEAAEARKNAAAASVKHALTGDHAAAKIANDQGNLAAKLTKQAEKAGARAGRSFNLADSSTLQKGLKAAGVSGVFTGASSKDAKSIADQLHVRAEAAAKAVPLTKGDPNKARAEAEKSMSEQRKTAQKQLEAIKEQKKSNEAMLKQLHQATVTNQNAKAAETAATEAAANAKGDDQARASKAARDAKDAARIAHEKLQKELSDNPLGKTFAGLENGVTAELTEAMQTAARDADTASSAADSHDSETAQAVRDAGEKAAKTLAAIQNSEEQIAQTLARGNVLQRASDTITGSSHALDHEVAHVIKKKRGANALLDTLKEEVGGGEKKADGH